MKKFEPVGVENYILHVENSSGTSGTDIARRMKEIVERSGVGAERICVENLQEGFDEVWERVEPAGVSICFDVGHLLFAGGDPMDFIDRYGGRIRMAHIHGADVKDHRPLSAMPKGLLEKILGRFMELKLPGAVIIENYSVEEMRQSLSCLSEAAGKLRAA
jgi:sugar phosphate isomerase/epimerase